MFIKDDFHSGSDSRLGRVLSSIVFKVDMVWKWKALLSPLFDGHGVDKVCTFSPLTLRGSTLTEEKANSSNEEMSL